MMMMINQQSVIHIGLQWIHTSVLILAILILFLSLGQYSQDSTSIFTLLHNQPTFSNDVIGSALIKDRRLIVTMVAAQVSIFCPLFLLSGTPTLTTGFWKTTMDLIYQFLMPLALSLCWLFCITFDRKTDGMLSTTAAHCTFSTVDGLKYLIILALISEMIFIAMAWIEHTISSLYHDTSKELESPLLPTMNDI